MTFHSISGMCAVIRKTQHFSRGKISILGSALAVPFCRRKAGAGHPQAPCPSPPPMTGHFHLFLHTPPHPPRSPLQALLPFIPHTIFLAELDIPPSSSHFPPPACSPHPRLRDPAARPARGSPSAGSRGSSGAGGAQIKNEAYL